MDMDILWKILFIVMSFWKYVISNDYFFQKTMISVQPVCCNHLEAVYLFRVQMCGILNAIFDKL